jgi:hypothetical protein
MGALECFDQLVKTGSLKNGTFATDLFRVNVKYPIELGVAGAPVAIPRAGSNQYLGPVVAALTGQGYADKLGAVTANNDHRTILALGWVFLPRNPGPDNFTRVWIAVNRWRVLDDDAFE